MKVDYSKGKIYKIVCNKTGLCYIGSTCENYLSKRLVHHRSVYKKYKEGKTNYISSSSNVLENNDYDIVLLELYPCNSKDELHAKERHYIENFECVNKNIPTRTNKEYYQDNKEKYKQYREDNKEEIKEYKKQYRVDNKDKIKQKHKQYREQHKDEIRKCREDYFRQYRELNKEKYRQYREDNKQKMKEYKKQYREDNKDNIRELKCTKFTCDCGGKYTYSGKSYHFKTRKHLEFTAQSV